MYWSTPNVLDIAIASVPFLLFNEENQKGIFLV